MLRRQDVVIDGIIAEHYLFKLKHWLFAFEIVGAEHFDHPFFVRRVVQDLPSRMISAWVGTYNSNSLLRSAADYFIASWLLASRRHHMPPDTPQYLQPMDFDRNCNFQIFAVVTGISEALVKMSLYHTYSHMTIIKTKEPMGGLVLFTLLLILRKHYGGGDKRSSILFKMCNYG